MNKESGIKHIKHQDIDSEKWNKCIDTASNSRIYAYDWHLDRTAIVWDALVYNNYQYVMPLPYRVKLGIRYVYQPLFTQQLGIFPEPPEKIAKLFYQEIPDKFFYSDVHLNSENQRFQKLQGIHFQPRKNYLLSLNNTYTSLISSYSTNTKRNLSKARKNDLHLITGIRLEEYMKFKTANLPAKISSKEINNLKSLIAFGLYKGFGEIYGVYTADNELCSAVYFCHWKDRIIYMNAASNEKGKEERSMYFLIDQLIQKYAGQNLLLDFEGSMIPGVARFYAGFGAKPETYFQLKFNRLPLPLKWLKR